jgi:hypothetical protein
MIPFQKPVKFGLISGFILIIYNVLLYALDIDIFSIAFSLVNGILYFGFMIALAVIGVNKMRDEDLEKKITYIQAFLGSFVILLISLYLTSIFSYILNGFIDTAYFPNKMDGFIANMEGKISEEQLNDIVKGLEESLDPVKAIIKSIWMSPLIALVVGAIIAAFIKKDKTEDIPV